jgi:TPR repeat protein
LQAFQYFSRVASDHAESSPWTQQARFVANAYVSLGNYYLNGIPNSPVQVDTDRAYGLFSYAASYFGDPDAQYYLARLYLDGTGTAKDVRQAARWFKLAAYKGQYQAQAMFGAMLFKGNAHVPRQPARGLMWLTLARDSAGPDETWINELYDAAFKQASADEQARAFVFLERWLSGQRD